MPEREVEPLFISDQALAEILAESIERWVRDGRPAPEDDNAE